MLGTLAVLTFPVTATQAQQPAFGPQFGSASPAMGQGGPAMTIPGQFSQMQVQPTQLIGRSTDDDDYKPLPPEIAAMPGVEEELEVIRRRSQLVITRSRISRIAIADPGIIEVVQYSPTEVSIIGVSLGATNLTFWFEGNPDPLIYRVQTIRDPDLDNQRRIDYGKLERRISILFPDSKVYLIPLSRKLIVKGQARDAEQAARILSIVRGEVIDEFGGLGGPQPFLGGGFGGLGGFGGGVGGFGNNIAGNNLYSGFIVNMLEVPGEHQVMLKVQIAELSRSQLRSMGVDISYLLNNGRHLLQSSLGGGAASTLTGVFEQGEISVLLNWLSTHGSAKILASPNVTVLSGHPASFLSGGEFAVPTVVGIGGAAGQTTTFRGFGTSLLVTPTVIDRDLVRMNIVPEFSSIDVTNAVGGVPGLNTNRVQTTVQLREGQTLALAGLFSRQQSTQIDRIPYLSDIPKIGPTLFANKRAAEDETELLILVTPEIVRPMDADEVPPVPGHYVTHPTDEQLYFHGMLEGPPDRGVYQLAPYGAGTGQGTEVGYRLHNPAPAAANYAPGTGSIGMGSGVMQMPPVAGGYGAAPVMPTPMMGTPVMQGAPVMHGPAMGQPMMSAPLTPTPSYPTPVPSGPAMNPGPSIQQPPIYNAPPANAYPTPIPAPQPTPLHTPGMMGPSAMQRPAGPMFGSQRASGGPVLPTNYRP